VTAALLRGLGCRLRGARYEVRGARCEVRVSGCGVRVTGFGLRGAGYGLRVTAHQYARTSDLEVLRAESRAMLYLSALDFFLSPSQLPTFATSFFSHFRTFSRGIVPPYRTTTGPTSDFLFLPFFPTSAFRIPTSKLLFFPFFRIPTSSFFPFSDFRIPTSDFKHLCHLISAIAAAILSSAVSSRLLGHPKLSRIKPGASNSMPSCNPTPASSKKAAGFLMLAARISIQAR